MAYPTAEQLRLLLGLPVLSADEQARAELLLDLAIGVIEDEAGQPLESSTDTVLLDGPTTDDGEYWRSAGSRKLVLPRWPVTAVTSVTLTKDDELLVHGDEEDYTWSREGILTRRGACWPAGQQVVEVVYTAGLNPIPAGLRAISLRLAAGAWDNPLRLTAESLGDHSKSYSAEALGMELSSKDLRAIAVYKARTSS